MFVLRNTIFVLGLVLVSTAQAQADSTRISHGAELQHYQTYERAPAYGADGHYGRGAVYRYRAHNEPVVGWQERIALQEKPRPWSEAWYAYCGARYASFDPRTGHYSDPQGRQILCR